MFQIITVIGRSELSATYRGKHIFLRRVKTVPSKKFFASAEICQICPSVF